MVDHILRNGLSGFGLRVDCTLVLMTSNGKVTTQLHTPARAPAINTGYERLACADDDAASGANGDFSGDDDGCENSINVASYTPKYAPKPVSRIAVGTKPRNRPLIPRLLNISIATSRAEGALAMPAEAGMMMDCCWILINSVGEVTNLIIDVIASRDPDTIPSIDDIRSEKATSHPSKCDLEQ